MAESNQAYAAPTSGTVSLFIGEYIAGHNRRWIDGSTLILSIDTIGHADKR
jgi:hypothetical protein